MITGGISGGGGERAASESGASASTADAAPEECDEALASSGSPSVVVVFVVVLLLLTTTSSSGERKLLSPPPLLPEEGGSDRGEGAAESSVVASSCSASRGPRRIIFGGNRRPCGSGMLEDDSENAEEISESAPSRVAARVETPAKSWPICQRRRCFMKAESTGEREESSFEDSPVRCRRLGLMMERAVAPLAPRPSCDESVAAERSGSDGCRDDKRERANGRTNVGVHTSRLSLTGNGKSHALMYTTKE